MNQNLSAGQAGLRPFFTFFGGKWRSALRYPPPLHSLVVEPFAGSAGYSLRYPDSDVVLVERDPVIAATWRYLISASEAEIKDLPLEVSHVDELDVPEGARYLIGWWLNKGTSRPRKRPSAWMRGGVRPGSFWGPEIRERVASQVYRIRHWRIVEGDYTSAPVGPATFYVDPPYSGAGKDYRYGSALLDYDRLAQWCRSREGQVVVCENHSAQWLPFRPLADVKATPGRGRAGVSREVVWLSHPM